ncbi:hypothetical protein [Paracoccus sp. (in: a-proteobacteria)]|uniref:hypothetical protein n=1 Tax=Paracoccus sp. TaxID=267 RepID=UPI0032206DFD
MTDQAKLARRWVEISEECRDGRIVLRPPDYPMPRSRGGRRHLDLQPAGQVRALGSGPADALECKDQGGWSLTGDALVLDLAGWQGSYAIEELGADILVLRRR